MYFRVKWRPSLAVEASLEPAHYPGKARDRLGDHCIDVTL
jgi:hypothetical protein